MTIGSLRMYMIGFLEVFQTWTAGGWRNPLNRGFQGLARMVAKCALRLQLWKMGPSPFHFELMWLEEYQLGRGWSRTGGRALGRLVGMDLNCPWSAKNWRQNLRVGQEPLWREVGLIKANILEELQGLDAKKEFSQLMAVEMARRIQLKRGLIE